MSCPLICRPVISKKSLFRTFHFMEAYDHKGTVVGCDEAGRGCLAGPVFAAAVILPKGFHHPFLNDSKKLSKSQRDALREIIENESEAWAVGQLSPEEIDEHNILWSSFMAMHRALDQLKKKADLILVDGNRFIQYHQIKHECIIKGDGKFFSIAAASVLAKTHRDEHMAGLDQVYPAYGWSQNQGYPTKAHRQAIVEFGPTEHHRKSFKLLPDPTLFDSTK